MLRRWRSKASARKSAPRIPSDVPAGHVAVCVGSSSTRFVVRATHLNHPVFKNLLLQAEEEYGFGNHGPLTIPCDESHFQQLIRFISRSESNRFDDCHLTLRNNLDFCLESRPLLH
uniref:Indole-3-acetic acid-induced protein ARG7 n=2 Tax=Cajanus cajan TaxID=3821 RepID=A0A151TKS1_CAJCA|nr:Indole-3-acetic acid-induced protein ARG7 [Cajanus cajan]